MEEELHKLVERRHTIIHCKPTMSINGDGRHTGNEPPVTWDEHDFVKSCTTLPWRLVENILKFDPESFMVLSNIFTYCGAAASEFEKRQNRLTMLVAKLPRELIHEIMQQGQDRKCLPPAVQPPKNQLRRQWLPAPCWPHPVVAWPVQKRWFISRVQFACLSDEHPPPPVQILLQRFPTGFFGKLIFCPKFFFPRASGMDGWIYGFFEQKGVAPYF